MCLIHPCTRMHMEDTHRWDWACLNIISSRWESLSRMMWQGQRNVQLILPSVLSVVSLGKSSQSIHIHAVTSHYQCAWSIILEYECLIAHLNGSQFRQVYSITHVTITHSQTQHENTHRMQLYQRWVIWEKACLVITLCEWEYSSTPMKHTRNWYNSFQSFPMHPHSQSHTLCNQRRNNDQSSMTSTWDNSSNRNDD